PLRLTRECRIFPYTTLLRSDTAVMVKQYEEQLKVDVNRRAKSLITEAIQRSAADEVTEATVSVIHLPNDDMKGRIIGRDGRNIQDRKSTRLNSSHVSIS